MSLYRGLRLALSQVYRQPDSAYSSTQRGDLKWRTKDENVRSLTAACCVFAQLCTIRVYLCRGRPWDMLMVVYGFCNKVCCYLGSVRRCPTFIALQAESPLMYAEACSTIRMGTAASCQVLGHQRDLYCAQEEAVVWSQSTCVPPPTSLSSPAR